MALSGVDQNNPPPEYTPLGISQWIQDVAFSANDGTEAAPGIAFDSENSTGFWRPGSGQIGVTLGGSELLTFKSTGLDFDTGTFNLLFSPATQTVGNSTISIPDQAGVNGEIVTTTAVQTLTNKTLTSPTITSPTISGAIDGSSVIWSDLGQVLTVDIDGGTLDSVVVGGTTPAAGTFTTLVANTSLALATGATVTAILDEDAMGSNSATALATQQSIKAYVDAQVTASDLDFAGDSGTGAVDLDSQTFTVTGGTGIDTSAASQTITISIDSTVAQSTDNLSFFAATTSAQLAGVISDETGSGALVFGTSPTIVTPTLTLKQGVTPAPTAEGDIQWDTDNNQIKVGDSVGTKTFSDDSVSSGIHGVTGSVVGTTDAQTLTNKTINTASNTITVVEADISDLQSYLLPADIGVSVQAYDAGLTSIAGLTTAANRMLYTTGSNTYDVTTLTTFARTILDDANAAAVRTTIDVDQAGTDNSTDVTLVTTSHDYLSIVGQAITLGAIDLAADVTGTLPVANGGTGATSLNNLITLGTHTTGNYVADITAGTAIDVSGGGAESATVTVNVDLSELATSVTDGDGDFFVVVDSVNAQRKLTKANIALSGFNNDAGWTSNTGDIEGVTAGTGLSGGGTSGTVSLDVDASLTHVTAVGTLTTGTWNATAIGAVYGGTGLTTYATGDILYASAVNTLAKLAAGTNGDVLTLAGGVPSWQTPGAPGAHASTHADGGSDPITSLGAFTLTGDITPGTDSLYDLGTNTFRFAEAYIDTLTLTNALAVAQGGTAATSASGARTNLGLVIGTDVQAYDADLTTIGGLSKTDGNFIVANGSAWTVESGATARTSLGLGSLATQSSVDLTTDVTGTLPDGNVTDALTISGGTVDNTVIGGSTAAAGTFTTATADTVSITEDGKIDFSNTAPGTSGDATGVIFSFTAGATLAVGDVVYLGTGGKVLLADADAATSMPALGICTSTGTDTNPVDVMIQGIMKLTGWSFTAGDNIFVSTTAGDVTSTAPSGTGDTVQKVGVATASDAVYFNFNTTELVLA